MVTLIFVDGEKYTGNWEGDELEIFLKMKLANIKVN